MLIFPLVPNSIHISQLEAPEPYASPAAVPPPRFEGVTFDDFVPANTSQESAVHGVREFIGRDHGGGRSWWRPWRGAPEGEGLYLDGGYGVGKTHLLAAAFNAAESERRAYFTFQELVHRIGADGLDTLRSRYSELDLVCIDEFELDDPGNTLIVKRFLEALMERGCDVMTTSNTPPEAQGEGRFNAEDFQREIQGIASRFRTLRIEGRDYRKRESPPRLATPSRLRAMLASGTGKPPRVVGSFGELLELLGSVHPVRYRTLLQQVGTLYLHGVTTIPDQSSALRFVHFIDQLYDQRVELCAAGEIDPGELFDPSYRNSAYARKHERCLSRMGELIDETLALSGGQAQTGGQAQAGGRARAERRVQGFD